MAFGNSIDFNYEKLILLKENFGQITSELKIKT